MTNYTELIHALRYCANRDRPDCSVCEYEAASSCKDILKLDAAAAIEELQAVLKEADKKQEYQHDCICELTAENEEHKAEVKRLKMHCADCEYGNSPWPEEPVHEPKRGERTINPYESTWAIENGYI